MVPGPDRSWQHTLPRVCAGDGIACAWMPPTGDAAALYTAAPPARTHGLPGTRGYREARRRAEMHLPVPGTHRRPHRGRGRLLADRFC